jgi:glutamyl-tRNA reductase
MIINIRVDYTIADIETMEKLSIKLNELFNEFRDNFYTNEYIQISTCNRYEYYIYTNQTCLNHPLLDNLNDNLIVEYDDLAIFHLLRLASGLESMIVGEDQILGQIKQSLQHSKKEGYCGKVLETLFTKAIHVGQVVRQKTNINRGSVSIGSAAVNLAEQHFNDLTSKCVLVIGAGKMGTLVAKALSAKNLKAILVANRTYYRAIKLAEDLNGDAILFNQLNDYIAKADLIISATASPHIILDKQRLGNNISENRKHPIILIDLANPRDISDDVKDLNVRLHNIDDLREIANVNKKRREKEAIEAEKIIQVEFELLKDSFKIINFEETLSKIRISMEEIRKNEVEKAISKLNSNSNNEKIIEGLSNAIVNKIFHNISTNIKKSAKDENKEIIETIKYIFK